MKKFFVLVFGLLFAFQIGAFAKDKDSYSPPVVPDAKKECKTIQDEDKNCKDISPIHGQNCNGNGKHNGNGNGNGNGNDGKDNGKGNDGKDNGKGNDGKDNGKGNDGKDNGKGNDDGKGKDK